MKKESTASDDLFDLLFVAQDIEGQNVVQMNTELSLCPQAAKAQYIDQTVRPYTFKVMPEGEKLWGASGNWWA